MIRRITLALGAFTLFSGVATAQGRVVSVTASDYTFDAPDTIPAGLVTFSLVNRGPELHHMQVIRLEQGKTLADLQAAMKNPGPPPAWITPIGGPNAGVPDGKMAITVTATLKPGNYVMLCFIDSPDKTLHVMKGMFRAFTVVGATNVAQAGAPKPDVVVTLHDYNFDLDKALTAGRRTILFRNTAQQEHEAFIARLNPGSDATALIAWIGSDRKSPPPAMPAGGIVGIAPGQENLWTVDLAPGEYGLFCFVPDKNDGKSHIAHGMFKQITVK